MPLSKKRFSLRAAELALCGLVLLAQPAWPAEPDCRESGGVAIWTSPRVPLAGKPLKILAVASDGALQGVAVNGAAAADAALRGGPPWSVSAVLDAAPAGAYRLEARRDGQAVSCRQVQVGQAGGAAQTRPAQGWDVASEAFYSAWIEQLFGAPLDANMNFPSLEPLLRDPARNFLYNHFGGGEDGKFAATPDCADLPYFLRSYFAWKISLPVSYRACDRGSAKRPPHCGPATVLDAFRPGPAPLGRFKSVIAQVNNGVHSGSARTGLRDDASDLYPLPLHREALWPGTVYADPYGHTLMIASWVPAGAGHSGLLLAVDAQPDNSVARKRFWPGTFLFAGDAPGAGPGFKAFRPTPNTGNAALAQAAHRPYSDEQAGMDKDTFYARMGKLIDPDGLDPSQAYEAMLDALVEQLNTRVESINNGERYRQSHPNALIDMPKGAAIFETLGPWEDYSTPSRDMRLIIAMNVLAGLPEQIVRHPELFVLGGRAPEQVKAEIEQLHRRRIAERSIQYSRSDGSAWPLSVAEIFTRQAAFEMAYNPNDCAERRWGAQPGTAEYATCHRQAPPAQLSLMEQYRPWFREARRPPR